MRGTINRLHNSGNRTLQFLGNFLESVTKCACAMFVLVIIIATVTLCWAMPFAAAMVTKNFWILLAYIPSIPIGYGICKACSNILDR